MQKWIMFVVFVGASVLGLYLMTFGLPEKPVDEAAELPEGVSLLKIQASDWEFDQAEYRVKAGETYKVTLQNKSGFHGVEIANTDIKLDKDHASEEYVFENPGTYEIICNVPCGEGHLQMKSVLIVE
ncbi:cytochrome C oxidase subunit II [Paenibacillus tarimensis]